MTNLTNSDNEIWREVPGFPGYECSTIGRVKSIRRLTECENIQRKPKLIPERILKQAITGVTNYRFVTLYKKRKPYQLKVHRAVALTFLGPSSLQVNHKDGDKSNNNLSNLEYIEHRENARHHVTLTNKGSSKYRGVSFNKRLQSWKAEFRFNGKKQFFGYFKEELAAANMVASKMAEFGLSSRY